MNRLNRAVLAAAAVLVLGSVPVAASTSGLDLRVACGHLDGDRVLEGHVTVAIPDASRTATIVVERGQRDGSTNGTPLATLRGLEVDTATGTIPFAFDDIPTDVTWYLLTASVDGESTSQLIEAEAECIAPEVAESPVALVVLAGGLVAVFLVLGRDRRRARADAK
jgi:hypothetical protein